MEMGIWIAVGSVATAVIVLLNLFLIFIKPRLEEPKFTVEFEAHEPFCRETEGNPLTSDSRGVTAYWLRVRVKNSGRSVAKYCLGKIIEVTDSEGKAIFNFDPTVLHWVATDWGAVPFLTIDLNPDDYEYMDTFVTQFNYDKVRLCGDQFEWARYEPRGIKNSLEPGKYIIHLSVYGANVKPKTKYLSLIWGGKDLRDILLEVHDSIREAKARLRQENVQGK